MAALQKKIMICGFLKTLPIQSINQRILRVLFRSLSQNKDVARPLQAVFVNHTLSSSGRQSNSPTRRAWNVAKGVQNSLRQDALYGNGFRDTIFHSPYPVIQNDRAQELCEQFNGLNNYGKKQLLIEMDKHQMQSFLREMATSNMELRSTDQRPLSDACRALLASCSLTDTLRITDLLYVCGGLTDQYVGEVLEKIMVEWPSPDLDHSKVLQLLFYIGIYRHAPPQLMDTIENYLIDKIRGGKFTISQIGLICHAFFASNHALKNYFILEAIADQTSQYAKHAPLYAISNITKVLHHAGYSKAKFYNSLADQLCQSEKISGQSRMPNLNNIISAYGARRFLHPRLFDKITDAVSDALDNKYTRPRLKDLARIVWSCKNLQHTVPDVLIEDLEWQVRSDNFLRERHPQAFMEAVLVLAMCGVYVKPQISYLLSPEFDQAMRRGSFEQHYQRLVLHSLIDIGCPDYEGNRLSQDYIEKQRKTKEPLLGLCLYKRQGFAATWLLLEDLFGKENVKSHFITPFSKLPDIELRLTHSGAPTDWCKSNTYSEDLEQHRRSLREKLEKPSKNYDEERGVLADLLKEKKQTLPGTETPRVHLLPTDDCTDTAQRKIVIKVLGENQYVQNDETKVLGIHKLETQVLLARGYEVFLVHPRDAARLDGMSTIDDKYQFVKRQILKPLSISECS